MKKNHARIALMAFSLASALLAAEIGLRMAGFPRTTILGSGAPAQKMATASGRLMYRGYLPGTFMDFNNHVVLNQWGFHDGNYNTNRPSPNTYRVMVLGDSYVAGMSVQTREIFHKLIERRLRREDPLKRGSYEVMAFGQGATAQKQEFEWLRKFGPRYRPDLVMLVFFCGNDVMENSTNLYRKARDFGNVYASNVAPLKVAFFNRLLLCPPSRVNGMLAEALTSFYAGHLYRFARGITADDLESPELGVYAKSLSPEWEAAFTETDRRLKILQGECDRQGATFVIACLEGPQATGDVSLMKLWDTDSAYDFDRPQRWLAGWSETNRVPMCDLGPDLIKAGWRNIFWRHDGHLNPRGNDVVAEPLYDFIVANAAQDAGCATAVPQR